MQFSGNFWTIFGKIEFGRSKHVNNKIIFHKVGHSLAAFL